MNGKSNQTGFIIGQNISLQIRDLNHRGEGVGKADGFTLFVPGALPGETVNASITQLHKNYGQAELVSIEQVSLHRVKPACPHFSVCGGCSLQHLGYDSQLAWKTSRVTEALRRIAGLETAVKPITGMQNPWRYRNKAGIHLGIENGSVVAGFYQHGSKNIIDIKQCPVQHPLTEQLIASIRSALNMLVKEGAIKKTLPVTGATIRTSFSAGKSLIVFHAAPGRTYIKNLKHLAQLIVEKSGDFIEGIVLTHHGKNSAGTTQLYGHSALQEDIDPFKYRISPLSFFQVNSKQAKVLYEKAVSLAGEPRTALDIYCGTGNFSLYLSRAAESVTGIDSSGDAIRDALANASLNSIDNISFVKKRAENITENDLEGPAPLTIYLNPPRSGCPADMLKAVTSASANRIIYISCNPATLARDLAQINAAGFTLQQVQPIDMFPHTTHVETVCLLMKE